MCVFIYIYIYMSHVIVYIICIYILDAHVYIIIYHMCMLIDRFVLTYTKFSLYFYINNICVHSVFQSINV